LLSAAGGRTRRCGSLALLGIDHRVAECNGPAERSDGALDRLSPELLEIGGDVGVVGVGVVGVGVVVGSGGVVDGVGGVGDGGDGVGGGIGSVTGVGGGGGDGIDINSVGGGKRSPDVIAYFECEIARSFCARRVDHGLQ